MRPGLEPVDDSAVHKGWELSHPCPEDVPYWREGQHHVQIASKCVKSRSRKSDKMDTGEVRS